MVSITNEFNAEVKRQRKKLMEKYVQQLKDATPVDTGEARDGWKIEGDKIVNNVDHIVRLNEGSSRQAPSRFIEKTLLRNTGVSPNGVVVSVTP